MSKSANGEGYCRRIDTNKYECTIMSRYINPKTGKEKRIKYLNNFPIYYMMK